MRRRRRIKAAESLRRQAPGDGNGRERDPGSSQREGERRIYNNNTKHPSISFPHRLNSPPAPTPPYTPHVGPTPLKPPTSFLPPSCLARGPSSGETTTTAPSTTAFLSPSLTRAAGGRVLLLMNSCGRRHDLVFEARE